MITSNNTARASRRFRSREATFRFDLREIEEGDVAGRPRQRSKLSTSTTPTRSPARGAGSQS